MFTTLKSTQHKCRTNVNIRVQGLWQIRKTHRRGTVITSGTLQQHCNSPCLALSISKLFLFHAVRCSPNPFAVPTSSAAAPDRAIARALSPKHVTADYSGRQKHCISLTVQVNRVVLRVASSGSCCNLSVWICKHHVTIKCYLKW